MSATACLPPQTKQLKGDAWPRKKAALKDTATPAKRAVAAVQQLSADSGARSEPQGAPGVASTTTEAVAATRGRRVFRLRQFNQFGSGPLRAAWEGGFVLSSARGVPANGDTAASLQAHFAGLTVSELANQRSIAMPGSDDLGC